jgi:hypothetical protein
LALFSSLSPPVALPALAPAPQAGQKSYDLVRGLIAINYAQACFKE